MLKTRQKAKKIKAYFDAPPYSTDAFWRTPLVSATTGKPSLDLCSKWALELQNWKSENKYILEEINV